MSSSTIDTLECLRDNITDALNESIDDVRRITPPPFSIITKSDLDDLLESDDVYDFSRQNLINLSSNIGFQEACHQMLFETNQLLEAEGKTFSE